MLPQSPSPETTFGYLSILETPEHGCFGGYLIISPLGRPLEFHCTSPVRPSRAQEILYGPSLQPYLIGEQIAGALLQAAKLTPAMILTDIAAILTARPTTNVPMALVLPMNAYGASEYSCNLEGTAAASNDTIVPPRSTDHHLANYDLQTLAGFESDGPLVTALAIELSRHVDLAEPLGRIHDAIREAQRIGGRTPDAHVQAA